MSSIKQGRHEVKMPTVADHYVGYHLGMPTSEWLVAEWGWISAYDTKLVGNISRPADPMTQVILINTSHSKSYDDSDTPTELWCREHMVELTPGAYEVEYE